jgi:hypothetical protein
MAAARVPSAEALGALTVIEVGIETIVVMFFLEGFASAGDPCRDQTCCVAEVFRPLVPSR